MTPSYPSASLGNLPVFGIQWVGFFAIQLGQASRHLMSFVRAGAGSRPRFVNFGKLVWIWCSVILSKQESPESGSTAGLNLALGKEAALAWGSNTSTITGLGTVGSTADTLPSLGCWSTAYHTK